MILILCKLIIFFRLLCNFLFYIYFIFYVLFCSYYLLFLLAEILSSCFIVLLFRTVVLGIVFSSLLRLSSIIVLFGEGKILILMYKK